VTRGSSAWAQANWGDPTRNPNPMKTLTLANGWRVHIPVVAEAAFVALYHCFVLHGYQLRANAGTYNVRPIRGSNPPRYSNHSWGIAWDLNVAQNPMKSPLTTDMPAPMIADIEAIRTTEGLQVWRWGGRFARTPDPMHFELLVTPRELRAGLTLPMPAPIPPLEPVPAHVAAPVQAPVPAAPAPKPAPVAAAPKPPAARPAVAARTTVETIVADLPTLRLSSVTATKSTWVSGPHIKTLQALLAARGHATAAIDGVAGPATRDALARFQTATKTGGRGPKPDLAVGASTWRALIGV
jgi:hypothetical protein